MTTLLRNLGLTGVSAPQLAFVRSWAEGLDVAAAWQRYLAPLEAPDLRRARAELQRLLDQLRTLARAHGRAPLAALLRRDPAAMVDVASKRPSLEAFREQQPPDFYSEDELVELYEATFGRVDARSAARRRQRLRERLLQALQWFDTLVPTPPQLADGTQAWLDERLCARLALAGVTTLAALRERAQRMGPRWHQGVPRLGEQGAQRLAQWWQGHADTLGPWPSSDTAKADADLAPRFGLVPLERLAAPADLDGRHGWNRVRPPALALGADDDLAAVRAWLGTHSQRAHTWRSYRREAERWLLWAWLERGCALSALGAEDCAAYLQFVRNPGKSWTVGRQVSRLHPAWRPFEAGLSERSVAVAQAILQALGNWLVRQRYWQINPWAEWAGVPSLAPRPQALPVPQGVDRSITSSQGRLLWQWVASQPPSPARSRHLCALALAYGAGLRLSEMAAARRGWLAPADGVTLVDGQLAVCMLRVPGPDGRVREVPLSPLFAQAIEQALGHHSALASHAGDAHQQPLLATLRDGRALSTARVYGLLRALLVSAGQALADQDPQLAAKLSRASTHWLRHSWGLQCLADGVPQALVQARLGHASPVITGRYGAAIWLTPN